MDRLARAVDRLARTVDRLARTVDRLARTVDRLARTVDMLAVSLWFHGPAKLCTLHNANEGRSRADNSLQQKRPQFT